MDLNLSLSNGIKYLATWKNHQSQMLTKTNKFDQVDDRLDIQFGTRWVEKMISMILTILILNSFQVLQRGILGNKYRDKDFTSASS